MAKRNWPLELIGIPFIVVAGSLLHFTFAWSGYSTPVALIAAVNEFESGNTLSWLFGPDSPGPLLNMLLCAQERGNSGQRKEWRF